jgi:DNA-binding MarR family transcriptional regulator
MMSKDHSEIDEISEDPAAKKLRKAELKAAEKAEEKSKKAAKAEKKRAKAAEKAMRKAEDQQRKAASDLVEPSSNTGVPTAGQKKKAGKATSRTSPSGTTGLGAKLQMVARLTRSNLAVDLLEHGLYAGQEQVLFLLDEHGPLALTELADKLDIRAPTITKTVIRMESQAFLSRAVSRDDARSTIISLAPEGRRVLKIARQIVHNVEAGTFSSLNSADREHLDKCLDLVLSRTKNP